MMLVFLIHLILTFCRATSITSPSTEKERVLDEMFPPVKIDLSNLALTDLTNDLWLYLAGHLDATSLWNLGLTCKTIGAILRQVDGYPTLFKQFPAEEILDMLVDSELVIDNWADSLMTRENLAKMKFIQSEPKYLMTIDEKNVLSMDGMKALVDIFLPRAKNLAVEKLLHMRVGNRVFIEINEIPEVLNGHVFSYVGTIVSSFRMFYLPEQKEKRLFDLIDPSTIGKLSWGKDIFGRETLFTCSVLADYVLPVWRGEYTLSEHEMVCIKALVENFSVFYQTYFNSLAWALFFITGSHSEFEATTVQRIAEFLKELGFSWNDLMEGKTEESMNRHAEHMMLDMQYIYAAALQWNLDLTKLAHATPSNPISKQVLAGSIPASISELAEINEISVFNIAHQGLSSNLVKVNCEFGKFSLTCEKASFKRKRDDNDICGADSNKRQNCYQKNHAVPTLLDPSSAAIPFYPPGMILPHLQPLAGINQMNPDQMLTFWLGEQKRSFLQDALVLQLMPPMPIPIAPFPQFQMPNLPVNQDVPAQDPIEAAEIENDDISEDVTDNQEPKL